MGYIQKQVNFTVLYLIAKPRPNDYQITLSRNSSKKSTPQCSDSGALHMNVCIPLLLRISLFHNWLKKIFKKTRL